MNFKIQKEQFPGTGPCLVTDRERTHISFIPPTPALLELMGDCGKVYMEGHLDADNQVVLSHVLADQNPGW